MKVRRILILICFFQLCINYSWGQSEDIKNYRNIHLISGKQVSGLLISQDTEKVVLENDGITYTIPMANIDFISHIEKKELSNENQLLKKQDFIASSRKIHFTAQVGALLERDNDGFSVSLGSFYRINDRIALGVTSGLESYRSYGQTFKYVPILASGKYYFKADVLSLFVGADAGTSIDISPQFNQGSVTNSVKWNLAPKIGLEYWKNSSVGLSFNVGYKLQKTNYSGSDAWGGGRFEQEITFKRLQVGLGVIF